MTAGVHGTQFSACQGDVTSCIKIHFLQWNQAKKVLNDDDPNQLTRMQFLSELRTICFYKQENIGHDEI